MNDVVFENLLCDAAAQLREERLEKIKLPHKNRHILRAFAVCVCAAILSLAVVYAVPSMRAQLFSLLQIEEESDWILRFESQTQTEPITTLPEFTPNWLPEDTVRTKFNSSEGPLYDTYSYRQSQYGVTVNSLDIAIFPAQDIQLYLPKEDFPLEMDETTTSIRTYYYLDFRFLYKGIIIKHNKTEPTYTKTSLFLCEKRRFFMARTEKGVVATI